MYSGIVTANLPSFFVSLARGISGRGVGFGARAPAQVGVSARFGSLRTALEDAFPIAILNAAGSRVWVESLSKTEE